MKDIRILVVDDAEEILNLLIKYLEREGYKVDSALDGQEGLQLFRRNKYHLIILDVMMPKIDGIELCKRMRNETNAPIVMLTAKDDEIDKVLGLRIGADDYITKPFSMTEFIARINAHLRRYLVLSSGLNNQDDSTLAFGNLKIDLKSYTVYRGSKEIKLTAKEFELLRFFVNNPNQVFTKAQIFKNVWDDTYIEDDNTVMVYIRRLRKKIEQNPNKPKFIQTVWGIGYKFIGE
ncbi:response regulator transcription factor [Paramaledivibacter caminithermalis]|jgi:DNA-binding response OmpR family regulator|uniref:Stage 0 sporulation protein A homolog n=1 Tax=Paramaledivibacter caminithermalis (strain DSM 15212 / CIP 107654 / DViRD3) TaxID=1121301 RepID=A0A1M6NPB4_PARC5|nr:response regulator transcription factor [Paramaledivibacter caminithermalis]SHJ97577.1 DNA-binding response regulator, OmpR family, contains REC and winged-helix (wHTH) domain [Paramaledivibacter caminithermalis DSM 15212]